MPVLDQFLSNFEPVSRRLASITRRITLKNQVSLFIVKDDGLNTVLIVGAGVAAVGRLLLVWGLGLWRRLIRGSLGCRWKFRRTL